MACVCVRRDGDVAAVRTTVDVRLDRACVLASTGSCGRGMNCAGVGTVAGRGQRSGQGAVKIRLRAV